MLYGFFYIYNCQRRDITKLNSNILSIQNKIPPLSNKETFY